MSLKEIFKQNKLLFYPLIFVWFTGFIYYLYYGKEQAFLSINTTHNAAVDSVMKVVTHLGEFYLLLPVLLYLYAKQVRLGVGLFIAYAGATLLSQGIKYWAPWHNDRPSLYFYLNPRVHYVPDYFNNVSHSFPSGHTTLAFVVLIYLALTLRSTVAQLICLTIAVVAAYSRVYLAQHFVEDLLGGAFIGSTFAILCYVYFTANKRINSPYLNTTYLP
ncbi:MAG: phosphatase PAP2 family protein [Bacteroidia bacterium]|nr:phosphatase PAP2 family protein [Bacteroidia bacterium]